MKRFTVLAAGLFAALPATARADVLWDLIHDAGSGGSYAASSKTITKVETVCGLAHTLACGSIVVSTQSANFVFGNEYDVGGNSGGAGPLGAYSMGAFNEKGLGICVPGSSDPRTGCLGGPQHREIDGPDGTTPLYLDLTGVTNVVGVNHIWLSSAQSNSGGATLEGWQVYGSLVGTGPTTGTSYTLLCSGAGQTMNTDIADCAIPIAAGPYKFLRVASVNFGDVSIQALSFEVSPEPGTMVLLASGLFGLVGARIMRRHKQRH